VKYCTIVQKIEQQYKYHTKKEGWSQEAISQCGSDFSRCQPKNDQSRHYEIKSNLCPPVLEI
jgi:hypothetical protein